MQLVSMLRGALKDRKGVTALEYGLIAALIAVVIVVSVTALGPRLSNTFNAIANALPA
ncbi:Flp family type IVb pilin [Plastoroseomonas hellenica]|uniref:Flp family type IVb pilin n=1 Tax=Plastoroseomonas hellenica TaxID=2687306 RepID=A0ABS5EVC8_9PROT|nr:Flp family type IVb pilin [Plastoroseomonas hellenica]MBR0642108.1 Flp family type IVb pilin [Plastoroseomonas hellenica]MBR0664243.1 Flp family type IVb pilin [Plastoroseomonas hellenica]